MKATKFIPEKDDKRIVHIYESIGDMIAHADKHRDKGDAASGRPETGNTPWSGVKSWQEAMGLAADGWHDTRPAVDAVLNPLRESLAEKLSLVSERAHDICGYEPDIDRFIAGELECMYDDTFTMAPKEGKVYTLLVSGAVNSDVSPETLMKRGVAIVALVEAFQMVGSEVEIWVEDSFTPNNSQRVEGRSFSTLCRIHRAGDVLDVDGIMFPLAHPAWFRRFVFAECETVGQGVREEFGFHLGGGYGRAADLRVSDIVEPTFTLTKGGESRHTRKMDSDPLGFILDTLRDQGAFDDKADHWGN